MLKLTFLGTGTSQGVPMIGCDCEVCRSHDARDKRLRTSAMIESENTRIVIDAGPDFRYQMLREGVRSLNAILITHAHKDHIGGLDDIRAFNYFDRRPTDVYATEAVQEALRKDYDYAFAENPYPGAPEIVLHTVRPGEDFRVGELTVTPIAGMHYRLPVTGYRIGPIAYLTDFNAIADEEVEKLRGTEIFVVNALRKAPHLSHFNVEQALALSQRVGARQTYFTHMSHQIGRYEAIEHELPEGVRYAYDRLSVRIR